MPVFNTLRRAIQSMTVRLFISLAGALALGPTLLSAQHPRRCPDGCPAYAVPSVSITAESDTIRNSTGLARVSVQVHADYALDFSTYTSSSNVSGLTLTADGPGYSSGVAAGWITLSAGANLIWAHICTMESQCKTDSVSVYFVQGATGTSTSTAVVTTLNDSTRRNLTACASNCFGSHVGYTTPAYSSLDTPRALSLFHHPEQGSATVPVQFLVRDTRTSGGGSVSLRIYDAAGATYETFYGAASTELYFQGDTGWMRIGGLVHMSSVVTGSYARTAVITTRWSGGSATTNVPMRLLVLNEVGSPYGGGWTVAGALRVYAQSDALVLTNGAGGIESFGVCTAPCTATAPPGETSSLYVNASIGPDSAKYLLRSASGDTARFSASGRLLLAKSIWGDSVRYQYDTAAFGNHYSNSNFPRLQSITDPTGHAITLGYLAGAASLSPYGSLSIGSLSSITDPMGRVTNVYIDDPNNDLRLFTDSANADLYHVHYMFDHRAWHWGGSGTQWNSDYANAYKLTTLHTLTAPSVMTNVGSRQLAWTFSGPLSGIQSAIDSSKGTSGTPIPLIRASAPHGTITEPSGHVTSYWFDGLGQPRTVTSTPPVGASSTTTYSYNDDGRLLSSVTDNGPVPTYPYNGPVLPSIQHRPPGNTTTYADTTVSGIQLVKSVSVNGTEVTHHFYSGSTAKRDSTRSGTEVTKFTYDGHGRLVRSIDPSNHKDSVTYEGSGLNNSISVTGTTTGAAGSRTATVARDAFGRDTLSTDPNGNAFRTAYNARGLVSSTTQPGSITTTYGVSLDGTVDTLTDANSQRYITARNVLGWVTSRTDPNSLSETFAYDTAGNVTTYTNRRSQAVNLYYDTQGRDSLRIAGPHTPRWSYDTNDRWVAVRNGESVDTLYNDTDGRPTYAVVWRNGVRFEVANSYYRTGQQSQRTVRVGSDTGATHFVYDAAQRLTQLTNVATKRGTLRYNAEGMLDTLTIPTSASPSTDVKQFWNYFASHRVSASWHSNGATDVSYNIDNLDRIIQRTVGGYPYDVQRAYTYDGLGRLRAYADSAWVDNSEWYCPTLYEIDCYWIYNWSRYEIRSDTFAFDAVGNHTLKSASVGTGNRLTYFNGFTMTYDADGNMRTKISSTVRDTLDWNVLGQLERLSHTTGGTTTITTFGYDGLGRRVRKTVGGTTKRYLVDGDHVVTELDGSGNRVRDYSYLPGMDRPQSMVQHSGGAAYYFAQEEPGHVTRLLNSSGTVVNSYEYGPFGEPQSTYETIAQPLQFMGRERDEAGYYFVRARYYDPDLARFISEDPIGLAGGLNPYTYAANDPVNNTDPTGLKECTPEQIKNGWHSVKVGENEFECMSGSSLPPVSVTANAYRSNQIALLIGQLLRPIQRPLEYGGYAAMAPLLASGETAVVGLRLGSTAAKGAYQVYRGFKDGKLVYVGMTKDFARRSATHMAERGMRIEPFLDGLSRADARALEQFAISQYGLARDGGILWNKINSISSKNPIYEAAMSRGGQLWRRAQW